MDFKTFANMGCVDREKWLAGEATYEEVYEIMTEAMQVWNDPKARYVPMGAYQVINCMESWFFHHTSNRRF